MGCALKTFFILLLFSYVPLSLSDEVLDKIKTMEGRVLKLEEQNLSKESRILNLETTLAKGGFFSESAIRFSDLQISKKNYSKKLSGA